MKFSNVYFLRLAAIASLSICTCFPGLALGLDLDEYSENALDEFLNRYSCGRYRSVGIICEWPLRNIFCRETSNECGKEWTEVWREGGEWNAEEFELSCEMMEAF